MLVELRFKAFEEGKGIGRAAGKAGEDLALMNTANLARAGLDHEVAKRHLPVAAHGHTLAAANRQNRRAVVLIHRANDAGPGLVARPTVRRLRHRSQTVCRNQR
jgi:hypothetical protein